MEIWFNGFPDSCLTMTLVNRVNIMREKRPGIPLRVICHGRLALKIAMKHGWLPGARYTNLRDIRGFDEIGLIDIEWRSYNFSQHLLAVKSTRPILTIAKDIERKCELPMGWT